MSKALEKINQIASKESSGWINDAKARQTNKSWSKRSFKIAVHILRAIRTQKPINGMTQVKLAEALNVSPQYINKVVKGQENLTLETIAKIEQVLGIKLIEIPEFESSSIVYDSKFEGILKVNRNSSKSIVSIVLLAGEKNPEYEYDFLPNGTYGY